MKGTLLGAAAGSVLAPGSVVSSRFEVVSFATKLEKIFVYDAKDQRTGRAIALWSIPAGLLGTEAANATRAAVKAACGVTHKDLLVPFGSSQAPDGSIFIATEPLGATSAQDLIAKKQADGHVHAPTAAYQLIAHAINGLQAAHPGLAHGAIAPGLLRVDAQGHVKLAGLGFIAALVTADSVPREFLAPEVRKGATPTPASDVYSLGALFYALITGKTPDPSTPPSTHIPGLPPSVDVVVETCLSEDAGDRFESLAELKGALASLVAPSSATPPQPVTAGEDLDVPIEFDEAIDASAAVAAAPASLSKKLSVRPPANPLSIPPAAAAPKLSGPALAPAPTEGLRASVVDMRAVLDPGAGGDDAQRWMFVRGGIEHGPMTAREVMQALARNELEESDVVFTTDTSERKKVYEWDAFRDVALQAREKRKRQQHDREARAALAQDKDSSRAKGIVAVAVVVAAAGLSVAYYFALGPGTAAHRRQAEMEEMLASGRIQTRGAGVLREPEPPPSTTRRARSGGGGGGGGGGFTSYEEAMSIPVEMNFAAGAPGNATLSDSEVAAPLNGALSRFGQCATAEVGRGGSAGQVRIRVAVGGDGAPMGASVNTGSAAFKSCVTGIVRGLRWSRFNGPRVSFSWGFSLE